MSAIRSGWCGGLLLCREQWATEYASDIADRQAWQRGGERDQQRMIELAAERTRDTSRDLDIDRDDPNCGGAAF